MERAPLPRLTGPDTPLADDPPIFVERLAEALERQLVRRTECRRALHPDERLKPIFWPRVFTPVQAASRELHRPR